MSEKRLLLGTRNPARIAMLRQILAGSPVRVLTLAELGIVQEVEEDSPSTVENALKKARSYCALAGIATLAIDGGLHIERFPPEMQPGAQVKRVRGMPANPSDQDLMDYYIQALNQVGGESPGTWTGSQALAAIDGQVIVDSFTFEVRFTSRPRGTPTPGRILDPLMIDPPSGKYYTELAPEERPYYKATADFVLGNLRWV